MAKGPMLVLLPAVSITRWLTVGAPDWLSAWGCPLTQVPLEMLCVNGPSSTSVSVAPLERVIEDWPNEPACKWTVGAPLGLAATAGSGCEMAPSRNAPNQRQSAPIRAVLNQRGVRRSRWK